MTRRDHKHPPDGRRPPGEGAGGTPALPGGPASVSPHSQVRAEGQRAPRSGTPERSAPVRRLALLVGLLAIVGGTYAATGGWRRQLEAESARYRTLVREGEQLAGRRPRGSERRPPSDPVSEAAARFDAHREDPDARLAYAEEKWQLEGPAAALPVLDSAVVPWTDPRLPRMMAHLYRLLGREHLALMAYEAGLRQFPRDPDLFGDRALLYVLLGWQDRAEEDLAAAQQQRAGDLYLAEATLARARSDLSTAEHILKGARAAHPDDAEIVRQLAALAEEGGRHDEAVRLRRSIPPAEQLPADQQAVAAALLKSGAASGAQEALAVLDRLRTASGGREMPRSRFIRARCLTKLGRSSEAQTELETLLRNAPRVFGAAHALAELYRRAGRRDEAAGLLVQHQEQYEQRAALRRAGDRLLREPDSAEAHRDVGRLCLKQGSVGRAIAEFQHAGELDRDLPGLEQDLAAARAAATSGTPGMADKE